MQAIRQKLAVASTRRRLKQLWLDYKKASGLGEAEESRSHLSALMDSIAISEPAELNTIFDDWSEIVTALLEVAGARPEEGGGGGSGGKRSKSARAAAELAEKSLRVAETIVRDDRYRERLRELPRVLERVLAMLDGVETVERQRFVVRVLHHLTDAMASRYELHWAHSVDFKKVLKLLVAPDPMLKRDVLRLLRALIQQAEHGTGGAAGCQSDADAGSLATRLIHFPLAVVAKVAQSVWGDVSPNPCSPPETGGERLVAAGEYAQAAASSSSFPPSGGELCGATQRLLARRKLRVDAKSTAESAVDAMIETGEASTEHPPVRELLCMQGAVQALVDSLIEADSQTDGIEVVDTLRMLLLGNTRAQNDFRGIGGYAGLASFLRRFCGVQAGDGSTFGSAGGPSGSDDGVAEQRLLGSFFDILFTLTLDGMRSTTIQNFDALTMLFDIACGGNNVHARLAVRCLRDLLAVDAMNVVAFDAVDGAAKLLAVVATYMRKHDKMAPEAEFDGLFALIQDIDGLLQYVAVLESALDAEDAGRVSILGRYAQLFAEVPVAVADERDTSVLSDRVRLMVLSCVSTLVADRAARGCVLPLEFSRTVTGLLRSHLEQLRLRKGALDTVRGMALMSETTIAAQIVGQLAMLVARQRAAEKATPAPARTIADEGENLHALIQVVRLSRVLMPSVVAERLGQSALWLLRELTVQHYVHFCSDAVADESEDILSPTPRRALTCLCTLLREHDAALRLATAPVERLPSQPAEATDASASATPSAWGAADQRSCVFLLKTIISIFAEGIVAHNASDGAHDPQIVLSATQAPAGTLEILRNAFRAEGGLQVLLNMLESGAHANSPMAPFCFDWLFCTLCTVCASCVSNKIFVGDVLGFQNLGSLLSRPEYSARISATALGSLLELCLRTRHCPPHEVHLTLAQETPSSCSEKIDSVSRASNEEDVYGTRADGAIFLSLPALVLEVVAPVVSPEPAFSRPALCSRRLVLQPQVLASSKFARAPRRGISWSSVDDLDVGGARPASWHAGDRRRRSSGSESCSSSGSAPGMVDDKDVPILPLPPRAISGPVLSQATRGVQMSTPSSVPALCLRDAYNAVFLSEEAALMFLTKLFRADPRVQLQMIHRVSHLLESSSSICRTCSMLQLPLFLLAGLPQCHRNVRDLHMQLIVQVLTYDIDVRESRVLLSLLHVLASEHLGRECIDEGEHQHAFWDSKRCRELRLQLLLVVNTLVSRVAPLRYLSFDGVGAELRLPPIDKLPAAGHTIHFWCCFGGLSADEHSVFSWLVDTDHSHNEIMLKRSHAQQMVGGDKYHFCVRSDAQDQDHVVFDAFAVAVPSQWQHIVFTYYETSMSLFVDGRHVQDVDWTPSAKDRGVVCAFREFRGTMGPVAILEGVWTSREAMCACAQGASFNSKSFRSVGIESKILSSAHPDDFVGLPPPKEDLSLLSSVHSRKVSPRGKAGLRERATTANPPGQATPSRVARRASRGSPSGSSWVPRMGRTQHAEITGPVKPHSTRSIQSVASQKGSGGVVAALVLLGAGKDEQLMSLRVRAPSRNICITRKPSTSF